MTAPHISRIRLIGHASTEAVRRARFPGDEPLDRFGLAAARERARPHAGDAQCSPTRRCTQTAAALGFTAVPEESLAPWDMGTWRGRSLVDLSTGEPEEVRGWLRDPDSTPHGGESLTRLIGRVGHWLDRAAVSPRMVVVTDPAIIRAALAHALPGGWATFWRIDVSPLDHVDLRRTGGAWTLTALAGLPATVAPS